MPILGKEEYKIAVCEDCGAEPEIKYHMGIPYYNVDMWMIEFVYKKRNGEEISHTKCPGCVQELFRKFG